MAETHGQSEEAIRYHRIARVSISHGVIGDLLCAEVGHQSSGGRFDICLGHAFWLLAILACKRRGATSLS